MSTINFDLLKAPFPEKDIEWRIQSAGKSGGNIWARCLAYINNRAVMDRLDEVCGPENWQNDFKEHGKEGTVCGISIKIGDEWVTKWDGAEDTKIEAVKGGISSAMKRAAVQWGIGRYLYNLESTNAIISANGRFFAKLSDGTEYRWSPQPLPMWALPKTEEIGKLKEVCEQRYQKAYGSIDDSVKAMISKLETVEEIKNWMVQQKISKGS